MAVAIIAAVAAVLAAAIGAYAATAVADKQIAAARQAEEAARQTATTAQQQLTQYKRMFEEAPTRFGNELGRLLQTAEGEPDRPPPGIVETATALVSTRNGYRSVLDAIGNRLNGEIDALEAELKKPTPDPAVIWRLWRVLQQKWGPKMAELEVAVRKVMTELGLVPAS